MRSSALVAEFLGTAGLLIVVVGSGIMGESLVGGSVAIALMANSIATGAGLYALIQTFGPISGAHFNPVVSFVEWRSRRLDLAAFVQYIAVQIVGAVFGVTITHLMFGLRVFQLSTHDRGDARFLLSETVATFGLILVVLLTGKRDSKVTPAAVALYITGAYWCTSSTSFANPAVTIARCLTDTFSGIRWIDMPPFIAVQIVGAGLALLFCGILSRKGEVSETSGSC